jgi:hypothetical protein
VTWDAVALAFLFSHLAGDFLVQTDWQALHKDRGLGRDPVARRALFGHVATYLVAFVPVLVWLGTAHAALVTIGIAALIAIPHLLVDDRRLVGIWVRQVKGATDPAPALLLGVDQSFHLLFLVGTALLVTR